MAKPADKKTEQQKDKVEKKKTGWTLPKISLGKSGKKEKAPEAVVAPAPTPEPTPEPTLEPAQAPEPTPAPTEETKPVFGAIEGFDKKEEPVAAEPSETPAVTSGETGDTPAVEKTEPVAIKKPAKTFAFGWGGFGKNSKKEDKQKEDKQKEDKPKAAKKEKIVKAKPPAVKKTEEKKDVTVAPKEQTPFIMNDPVSGMGFPFFPPREDAFAKKEKTPKPPKPPKQPKAPKVKPAKLRATPAAANDDQTATPATVAEKKKSSQFGKKALSAAFNMAAGAAVTAVAKAVVVTSLTSAAAPVFVVTASALAVGAASTTYQHLRDVHKAKKAGQAAPKFASSTNMKRFAISSGFALAGGLLFLSFEDQIKSFFGWIGEKLSSLKFGFGGTGAETAATVTAPPPAPMPEPTAVVTPPVTPVVDCAPAIDRAREALTSIQGLSPEVADALRRAGSESAKTAAQGTKDLAYYFFNGFEGVPKDQTLAMELFAKAADAGNVQAQIDVLYTQQHGLAGVPENKLSSMFNMSQIHEPRAAEFAKAWGGPVVVPAAAFDAGSIVSQVPGVCLK